jgi:hypothetical protein
MARTFMGAFKAKYGNNINRLGQDFRWVREEEVGMYGSVEVTYDHGDERFIILADANGYIHEVKAA